ncbi:MULTISPECIES: hypothetical protein [unclassified Streptomyces]|uniref:hypothetical protein n=1 Tax=unclassified Streptomyces TaxID=2593676 RepID=UPI0016611B2D|nr:hypothetical protein [Streptomyces sp. CBMA152]MBD0747887.1 hypothetical protein [Streptomyces sp. CBMA152]
MSHSAHHPGSVLPDADAANEAIRDLVDSADADGGWPSEEYERLLTLWAAATTAELDEAA